MNEDRLRYTVTELTLLSLQGDITASQLQQLETLLRTEPSAVGCYVQLLEIYLEMSPQGSVEIPAALGASDQYDNWLQMLAEEEKSAPSVTIDKPAEVAAERMQPLPRQPLMQFKKSTLVSLILSTAAILLLVLFAWFAPPKMGVSVATLADSMNAKWASDAIKPGERLATSSQPLSLREGFVQILFDNQTRATIEAPAEFRLLTGDQIKLEFGKIYLQVPEQAYGFTLCTPNSKIIDLGTEFGVQVVAENTQFHVAKGKVAFVSGFKGNKVNLQVTEGDARRLSSTTGQVEAVDFNPRLFARRIDSDLAVVWRGENAVDLADIVGGGNGLGTGRRGACIDPFGGEWMPQAKIRLAENYAKGKKGPAGFQKVAALELVDGVFVPNADAGPVHISSAKHLFEQAPGTKGVYWGGVINVDQIIGQPIMLNGAQFGTPQQPALFMHANIGITFDLQAIRHPLPEGSIVAFSSIYGMSDSYINKAVVPDADFWVLVDGQLRFSKTDVTPGQQGTISISLTDADRFLTLVTTESGDTEEARQAYNDWAIFGTPKLIIK